MELKAHVPQHTLLATRPFQCHNMSCTVWLLQLVKRPDQLLQHCQHLFKGLFVDPFSSLCTLYTAELLNIITEHGLQAHCDDDGTQV